MESWIRDIAGKVNQLILYNNGLKSVTNVAANYTLKENDTFLLVSTASTTTTLSGVTDTGRRVTIKNGFASGTTTITGTIDGGSSATVPTTYGVVNLISDGVQWWTY